MRRMIGPDFDPFRVEASEALKRVNPGAVQSSITGCFVFPFGAPPPTTHPVMVATAPKAQLFIRCIANNSHGWDHVSVSAADIAEKTFMPTWEIMEWVKRRFFLPHEVAMQLHVATADHISNHPHVLHLWRPHNKRIPLPPKKMV